MPITLLNPDGLPEVELYRQVAVATGSRTVYLAGQVAIDSKGSTVGVGDLAAQVERCYLNVASALAAVGATFEDVVKLTVYVVDLTPDKLVLFGQGIARAASRMGTTPLAPMTGIGVSALADPDYLVEVEAIAVLD